MGSVSEEQLVRHGFGPQPKFQVLIAEWSGHPAPWAIPPHTRTDLRHCLHAHNSRCGPRRRSQRIVILGRRLRFGPARKCPDQLWQPTDVACKTARATTADISWLLRKRFAVVFCPVAIPWHGLQWWAACRPAGARPFHFGFGHARAGFGLQAGTDVHDIVLHLALRLWRRILRPIMRANTGRDESRQA
jgi:hypothetical protein